MKKIFISFLLAYLSFFSLSGNCGSKSEITNPPSSIVAQVFALLTSASMGPEDIQRLKSPLGDILRISKFALDPKNAAYRQNHKIVMLNYLSLLDQVNERNIYPLKLTGAYLISSYRELVNQGNFGAIKEDASYLLTNL